MNFIYVHLNRIIRIRIRARDANVIYICGPGHGWPGMGGQYLAGKDLQRNLSGGGAKRGGYASAFPSILFPGGIPSHAAAETPGSINEGGELGYSLVHAYGAVFDNPILIAACVIGDGEAETGQLAAGWHDSKFINPARDGAVLPILHLNAYKIANHTVSARCSHDDLNRLFSGYGYRSIVVAGDESMAMHEKNGRRAGSGV